MLGSAVLLFDPCLGGDVEQAQRQFRRASGECGRRVHASLRTPRGGVRVRG